jgi:hypothetical protein
MFSADSCSKQRSHKFAPFLRPEQGILSGVEKRRSDVSLAGGDWSGFHLAAAVRFGMVLFPLAE